MTCIGHNWSRHRPLVVSIDGKDAYLRVCAYCGYAEWAGDHLSATDWIRLVSGVTNFCAPKGFGPVLSSSLMEVRITDPRPDSERPASCPDWFMPEPVS